MHTHVHRFLRISYNGIISVFQTDDKGSTPFIRSYSSTIVTIMTAFIKRHWLNHVHWIWVRLEDDAPNDYIHHQLTNLFGYLVCECLELD